MGRMQAFLGGFRLICQLDPIDGDLMRPERAFFEPDFRFECANQFP
jgi:hypothetical protein